LDVKPANCLRIFGQQHPEKNLVMWGSISLAQSLIEENLIDECHPQH
jgi:hypothetical protein